MSDVITINTADAVSEQPTQIKTFDLIPADWPVLYKEVPEFDFTKPPVDPNEFASSLVETCKKYNGLGLSANQCGYNYRVFVMGAGDEYVAFFNPKLIKTEGEAHMEEGCLSFPLLMLRITRPKTIKVEYQDFTGEKRQATFDGLSARIFLHELDHMNGICYTDKVKPLALKSGIDKRNKALKKIATQQAYMMKAKQHGERQSKTN